MLTNTYSNSKIGLAVEALIVHWELLLQNDSFLLSFEQAKSPKIATTKSTEIRGEIVGMESFLVQK